jgi:hypothetical protein
MAKASSQVRLQVLLRPECRTEQRRREAANALRHIGLEVTGTGLTTLSARASAQVVAQLFGGRPEDHARAGRSGAEAGELSIPDTLTESVERVSVAPQHISMQEDATDTDPGNDKEKQ